MLTKAEINRVRRLADKKERTALGLFVAEGIKLVRELMESELRVREVYALPEASDALPFSDSVVTVSAGDMERISLLKTPSPVLALVEIPRHPLEKGMLGRSLALALDDVQDPGNLGTILRLADWFGIRDVFCSPATADCFNPKVVQATMRAIARVRVHYTELTGLLEEALRNGEPVFGTFMDGEDLYGAKLASEGIIVMGNEGKGISPAVTALVNRRIGIPAYPPGAPTSESLNVAVAAAIVCAEFRRRMR